MRCKIHPSEVGGGVCAPCLRERLTALAKAVSNATDIDYLPELRRKLGRSSPPQPLLFPRSASPHVYGIRPVDDYHPISQQPPQLDSAASGESDCGSGGRIRRRGTFSLFSFLFGRHGGNGSDFGAEKVSKSTSRLSAIIRGRRRRWRRKKKMSPFAEKEETIDGETRRKISALVHGRGMSPAEKEEDNDSEGGYMTDPSGFRLQDVSSPMRRAADNHPSAHHPHGHRKASGLGMALSPLMRPSPANRRSPAPSELGFSGELRGTYNTQRHRLSNASAPDSSSLGPNRSRKIANFGKFR